MSDPIDVLLGNAPQIPSTDDTVAWRAYFLARMSLIMRAEPSMRPAEAHSKVFPIVSGEYVARFPIGAGEVDRIFRPAAVAAMVA